MWQSSACFAQPVFRRVLPSWACALLAMATLGSMPDAAQAAITVYEFAAPTPAGIVPKRDDFRTAVGGGTVAGAAGDFGGLRREINWDGVPDVRADPNLLPADFFNINSPRGAVFSSPTPGASFAVSANAGGATPMLFGFAGDLQAFSSQRLFATVGSRTIDIHFFVPGTTTPATTSAFGAVFVDTERDGEEGDFTNMEFFDASDVLLFRRHVTPAGNQGLSFLGVVATAGEKIARVRITTPDNFLLSNGVRDNEAHDFVVMDDFLYATPTAVPEPAAWVLAGLGLAGVGLKFRQRGRNPVRASRCA